MKKLIFLLLMAVVLAGMAFAQDTVHPPGVFTLEAAMFGDGVDGCAVTPDTVLVMAMPVTAEPSSFRPVMAHIDMPIQTFSGGMNIAAADYYLRC
jgi:opacity protein-like surface antigen